MERAGDILKGLFSHAHPEAAAKYLPLFKNFQRIIGPRLAPHVKIKDIDKKILYAEVAHPGWMQALLLQKGLFIKRINELYPGVEIKDIKIKITKDFPRPKNRSQTKGDQELTSEHSAHEVEAMLASLDENELKIALKKLFASRPRKKSADYGG
jgi:hypothetical protein